MNWVCPHCKKIIMENIETKEIKEEYVQCPNCGELLKNPYFNNTKK